VFSDADAAALYDLLNPWDPRLWSGDRFYHELVMAADSVLDVGCGTGSMLACARDHGHRGRLIGLDPDRAALERARRRADVEWVEGPAADARWTACKQRPRGGRTASPAAGRVHDEGEDLGLIAQPAGPAGRAGVRAGP
jgi:SAM-dependent methyltransferase